MRRALTGRESRAQRGPRPVPFSSCLGDPRQASSRVWPGRRSCEPVTHGVSAFTSASQRRRDSLEEKRACRPSLWLELFIFYGRRLGGRSRFLLSGKCWLFASPPTPPHRLPLWVCFPLETISEASDMKEAMEIMPETLEYGIINARVLHFLKDVLCQVNGGRGRALGVCETGGGRPLRSWRVQVAGRAPAPGGVPVLVPVPLQSTRSQRQGERVLRRGAGQRVTCSVNRAFQVFLPALSFNQHKEASTALPPGEIYDSEYDMDLPNMPGEAGMYHSIQLIRDEFLMNIQKFANSIQRTMQQLEGKDSFFFLLLR